MLYINIAIVIVLFLLDWWFSLPINKISENLMSALGNDSDMLSKQLLILSVIIVASGSSRKPFTPTWRTAVWTVSFLPQLWITSRATDVVEVRWMNDGERPIYRSLSIYLIVESPNIRCCALSLFLLKSTGLPVPNWLVVDGFIVTWAGFSAVTRIWRRSGDHVIAGAMLQGRWSSTLRRRPWWCLG